jgi:DNA-binding MarR family transcriptional regulator
VVAKPRLTDDDYRRLLEFRTAVRKFLHYSKTQAEQLDLTPARHQLLLAVRGHPGDANPTIGQVAEHLLIRHHSAVELVDRAEAAGLVERVGDPDDERVVRVKLTRRGASKLERISLANVAEIGKLEPGFSAIRKAVEGLPG